MSTNNFTYENICVVVHDTTEYYCDICDIYQDNNSTCESCGNDSMSDNAISDFYDEDIVYFADTLSEKVKGFQSEVKRKWTRKEALILGDCTFYKPDGEHYATVYVTYKSGYYAGACLDYSIEREDEYNMLKTYEDKIQAKCKAIAKVLRTMGTEVKKVAQFSNGEAVYQKVDNK